jgi:uncharacterized protein involved in exopolysaccharide biosynthesis
MADGMRRNELLVDPSAGVETWLLARRALRRNWLLSVLDAAAFMAIGGAAAALLPREYWAQTKLVIRQNPITPALVHPQRTVPTNSDAPPQSTSQLVHERDVLLRIVREGRLVDRWNATRLPLGKFKDSLRARLYGPGKRTDLEDALVEMLDHRLRLDIDDQVVTISVTWPDRATALEVLSQAQSAFIESRRKAEVGTIVDSYRLLSFAAETARGEIDARLKDLEQTQDKAKRRQPSVAPAPTPRLAALDNLRRRVQDQVRYRQELEDQHVKKVADLKLQLAQQEVTLGSQHPDLLATRAALEQVSAHDDDLTRAQADEQRMLNLYVAQGGRREELDSHSSSERSLPAPESPDQDYAVINARNLLNIETDRYQTLLSRLVDTKLEMEIATAAFPYRFTVASPPRWPKRPVRPNVPFVLAGGLFAGLLSGMLAAILLELRHRTLTASSLSVERSGAA